MEFYISDCLTFEDTVNFKELSIDIKKAYYYELRYITDILGKEWIHSIDSVNVPHNDYLKIEKYISKRFPTDTKLQKTIQHYRKILFRDMFSRFTSVAENISKRLGKRIYPLTIEGGDFSVLPEIFEVFVDSCIHLLRNMIDHGIELSHERENSGKDPQGKIAIIISRKPKMLSIIFRNSTCCRDKIYPSRYQEF